MSTATLDFIREELSLPDGRRLAETLPSDPWLERDVLGPILATDGDRLPLHRLVYIELARGHYKTGAVAGVSIAVALEEGGTDVYAVASDLDQAHLLHEAIEGQCQRNRRLAAAFKRRRDSFELRNGSKIRVLSSDAPSAFGIGVDCRRLRIIADELTQWQRADLYHAVVTTLPKVADHQMVIISNAGVGPGKSWQWGVREAARQHGYLFSAQGTIASWIRPEDLEQVAKVVPPPIYQRYYGNVWVEEAGEFVPMELWDGCRGELAALDSDDVLVCGVDAAVSGDSFAIVSTTRDPARRDDGVAVRDVEIWAPPAGGFIDFEGPWEYLAGLCRRHRVAQVAFDVYQLHDFMTRFQREHAVWCRPFPQQAERAQADSDLFQLIRTGRLRHNGDRGLREHIANCGFKVAASEDSRARLVKRGSGKIDGAVALAMSASECLRLIL